jgi:PmbA protein
VEPRNDRTMSEGLKAVAEHVVRRAVAKGASGADTFIREDENFSVTVRMGEVETLKESISRNLRLRVFVGKRTATSQTSDLSPAVLDGLVDETVEMARLTSEDESGGLPVTTASAVELPDLQLVDPAWENFTPEHRIDWARRAEASAMKADSRITNSKGGTFEFERTRTVLANTLGFLGEYEGTGGSIVAIPIAQSAEGMQHDYWASVARFCSDLESPELVGEQAAHRALRRLGARKVRTCEAPVIFDPMTARTIVGHVFQASAGDAVYRKSSFLTDQLGRKVAASHVTIVDNARLIRGLGSSPFDDEGVSTQRTPIIENGVLENYLQSSYSARKLKARPTGNGSRTGSGSVSVGPTNFYLMPGTTSPEEMIASVKSGLYVVELIGHGVNTVTGDYSRGVVGLWIEDGKLTFPVQEVTIAGNLLQMLNDIEVVGNDPAFLGPIAAPSIKIRNMVISGE